MPRLTDAARGESPTALPSRSAHQLMVQRVRAEFAEMPGMRLTSPQLERLCGVPHEACRIVLDALVASGFLIIDPDGTYRRHPAH
jgi:hypothetical protein